MRDAMAKRLFVDLLMMLLSTSAAIAGDYTPWVMVDVDKLTNHDPPLYDTWGNFGNDVPTGYYGYDLTCWQAVSASMLDSVGFGGGTDGIYDWFYGHYGNVGENVDGWRDAINKFISTSSPIVFPRPVIQYLAAGKDKPNDDWAEEKIANSPIGLGIKGYWNGEFISDHSIAYKGYNEVGSTKSSWIGDPDADWKTLTLNKTQDWSVFEDMPGKDYNWMLKRTWIVQSINYELTFDVESAVYLIPEPATITLLGLGGMALIRRRKCS
jgi:hypothetical protein